MFLSLPRDSLGFREEELKHFGSERVLKLNAAVVGTYLLSSMGDRALPICLQG